VPCFSHTLADVSYFIEAFKETISLLKDAIEKGIENYIKGPIVKSVFRKTL
jgi:hypothetical protein